MSRIGSAQVSMRTEPSTYAASVSSSLSPNTGPLSWPLANASTWASRTPMRLRSSLLVAALARTLPLPPTMRLAVHPGDVTKPALIASITATLRSLLKTHRPTRFADLGHAD